MEAKQKLLRHFLEALAYRTQKALRATVTEAVKGNFNRRHAR
jgi:hypothetical protein